MDFKTYLENHGELKALWENYNSGYVTTLGFRLGLVKITEMVNVEDEINKRLLKNSKSKEMYNELIPLCFDENNAEERTLKDEFLSLVSLISKHPDISESVRGQVEVEDYNQRVYDQLSKIDFLEKELLGF